MPDVLFNAILQGFITFFLCGFVVSDEHEIEELVSFFLFSSSASSLFFGDDNDAIERRITLEQVRGEDLLVDVTLMTCRVPSVNGFPPTRT